jgi:1,4-dihydroxy-2-naphthoate octaprenyltransferase
MQVPRKLAPKTQPLAAGMLAVGLAFAIAADGHLDGAASTALFAVLLVLDAVVIEWLTRPRR